MTSENICKFEKFGHCMRKKECPSFHPSEVCTERVCNVSKCLKRHPQPCRYYQAGSCRFGDYCKYDHKKQTEEKELVDKINKLENENRRITALYENNEKELLERIEKLETENKRISDLNENKMELLKTRMGHLENEYVSFLKNQIEEQSKEETESVENKVYEDTLVNDDQNKVLSLEKTQNTTINVSESVETIGEQLYSTFSEIKEALKNVNLEEPKECLEEFRKSVNLIS